MRRNILLVEPLCFHCLDGDTPIITLNNGEYEIVEIKKLKNNYHDYLALSYNFENHRFEFKPITKFVYQGKKEVFEIKLRNGSSVLSTKDHRFYRVFHPLRRWKKVKLQSLSEILSSKLKNYNDKLLCIRKIPSLNKKMDEDLLWVEGLYTAEGHFSSRSVVISNSDLKIINRLISILERHNIPYSVFKEKRKRKEIIKVFIKKSHLKNLLKNLGNKSTNKHFLNDRLSLSEPCLLSLLNGYSVGDGYMNPKRNGNCKIIYNTTSNILARQLKLIHYILGRPLYSWFQVNHGGFGKNPIWRLYEFPTSHFNQEMFRGVSKVSIKKIEPVGKRKVYDITVADNHNFVTLDSGLIVHNCEDAIDAVLTLEDWLGDEFEIIDVESSEIPEELVKLPLESKATGKIMTPTFVRIDGDSMVKIFATELFFGDLGLLEGMFKGELPTDIPVGKHVPWIE